MLPAFFATALLAGCAGAGKSSDNRSDLVSPGAIRTESAAGGYLAGRFAARSEKNPGQAADFYAQALSDDPDDAFLIYRTMQLMLASGRMTEANYLAERASAFAGTDGTVNLIMASYALSRGDIKTVVMRMMAANRTGFNILLAPLGLAWAFQADGQTDKALQALDLLKDNAAFGVFRNYHSALINDLAHRPVQAEIAYMAALAESGATGRIVEAYGNFLSRNNGLTEAQKIYEDYLRQIPENSEIQELAYNATHGNVTPPRPMVATPAEGFAESLFGAALVLTRTDRGEASEMYTQLALFLRPNFSTALGLLGEIMESNGRFEEAIATYRRIDSQAPSGYVRRIQLARALDRAGQKDEAQEMLRKLSADFPDKSESQIALGDMFRAAEKFENAAAEYSGAISRIGKPEMRHWALFYARGIVLERAKKWDLAEKDLLKALELKPDEPLVLNYLGYSWVEQGINVDKARGMIESAVKQRPDDGYIVDSLGWALFRIGKYKEAVTQLERAVELRPEDPTINDHLGDGYWKVGRIEEARFQWRRALSLKPDQDKISAIQEKITKGLPNPQVKPIAKRGS